jgi:lipoprotein-anchoring transpeptidase ErfK/SrfK
MRHHVNRRTAAACALLLAPLAVGVSACSTDQGGNPLAATPYDAGSQVRMSAGDGARDVDSDEPLEVTAEGADRISDVVATDAAGRHVRGRLSEDGSRWRSTGPLAAGVRYTVQVSTENESGQPGRRTLRFQTRPADGHKLSVKFGPDNGTYGVGQPLVAELSHKVNRPAERATVERALTVRSIPHAAGSWHWVDGRTLHYRPQEYWPAKATVTARSGLEGVKVREGLRGTASTPLRIRTGDRVEALVDIAAHTMEVRRNGERLRTIPVTTGKAGFRTRGGTKVVLGKQPFLRMTGTSIGIPAGSSESYDLPVHWNTQITRSGEFLHAAPWSTGSQGAANVSHGCTGMSTANARWFYEQVRRGDLVHYTHSEGEPMAAFGNGFGDWNLSWDKWVEGSATHRDSGRTDPGTSQRTARLRFEM